MTGQTKRWLVRDTDSGVAVVDTVTGNSYRLTFEPFPHSGGALVLCLHDARGEVLDGAGVNCGFGACDVHELSLDILEDLEEGYEPIATWCLGLERNGWEYFRMKRPPQAAP
jgi:hypothetical protein